MVRSLDEVKSWLQMGSFNSKLIYHVGVLCNDATGAAFDAKQDELGQIRAAMMAAFERDEIHLFQKRVGNEFEYIAIKRSKERYKKHDDSLQRLFRIRGKAEHAETPALLSDPSVSAAYEYGSSGYHEAIGRCSTGTC